MHYNDDPFLTAMVPLGQQPYDPNAGLADVASGLAQPAPNIPVQAPLPPPEQDTFMQHMAGDEALTNTPPILPEPTGPIPVNPNSPWSQESIQDEAGTSGSQGEPQMVFTEEEARALEVGQTAEEDPFMEFSEEEAALAENDPALALTEDDRQVQAPRDFLAERDELAANKMAYAQAQADEKRAAADEAHAIAEEKSRTFIEQGRAKVAENEARAAELNKMNITSKSVMDQRSTAQKIGHTIAIILGGAQAAGRGPNRGLEMVMGGIHKEVADQKANITQELQTLNAQNGLVMNSIETEQAVSNEMHSRYLAKISEIKTQLKNDMLKYDPNGTLRVAHQEQIQKMEAEEAKSKAEQARYNAKVAWEKDKAATAHKEFKMDQRNQLRKVSKQEFTKRQNNKMTHTSQMTGHKIDNKKVEYDQQGKVIDRELAQNALVVGGRFMEDGSPYMARDKATASKVAKSDAATETLVKEIDWLMKSHAENGYEMWFTDEAQKRKATLGDAMNNYKEGKGLGAFDEGVRVLLEDIMGSAEGSPIANLEVRLATLKKFIIQGNENFARANAMGGQGVMKSKSYPKAITANDLKDEANPLKVVKDNMAKATDEAGALFALKGLQAYHGMGGNSKENAASIPLSHARKLVDMTQGATREWAQEMYDDIESKHNATMKTLEGGGSPVTRPPEEDRVKDPFHGHMGAK